MLYHQKNLCKLPKRQQIQRENEETLEKKTWVKIQKTLKVRLKSLLQDCATQKGFLTYYKNHSNGNIEEQSKDYHHSGG